MVVCWYSVMADTPSDSGSECPLYMRTSGDEGGEDAPSKEGRALYYKERLKELQSKAGLANKQGASCDDQPLVPDNHSNDINYNRRPAGEVRQHTVPCLPCSMLDTPSCFV